VAARASHEEMELEGEEILFEPEQESPVLTLRKEDNV